MAIFGRGKKNSPSGSPPTLAESLREAAQQLTKAGKIQVGHEAVILKQLRELADSEVKDVAALKAKHLGEHFAAAAEAADMPGDFIICDDYRRNDQTGAGWIGKLAAAALVLAGVAAGGIGGSLLVAWLTAARPAATPAVAPRMAPQEFEVRWSVKDGKVWKDVRPVEP